MSEIVPRQRIADAFASLTQPEEAGNRVQLAANERRSIAEALDESAHPLGAFAQNILDEWEHLDGHDQVAGLLLFTEITAHGRQRTRQLGVER